MLFRSRDMLFLGIDLISKRINRADRKRESARCNNLFFLKVDAMELLEALPESLRILQTFVMYPDPWPKKRHHKNRLINQYFLSLLARSCAPGSSLHFKSDSLSYFNWTIEHLLNSPDWDATDLPWPHKATSFFEQIFSSSYECSAQLA